MIKEDGGNPQTTSTNNIFHFYVVVVWCKYDPLTHPMNQSAPEDGSFNTGKVTWVADTSIYGPAIKGNPNGLNDFMFIPGIIHLHVGAQKALIFKDCR